MAAVRPGDLLPELASRGLNPGDLAAVSARELLTQAAQVILS